MGGESSDDDEYVFFGTPLQDEAASKAVPRGQVPQDPSLVRAAPVHQQEALDEQGRRRFHGAFTGGFSAGYFNTVGSKEGFAPASFKSSRSQRAAVASRDLDAFLDEDELEERRAQGLALKGDYDTFGAGAAAAARREAEAAVRPSTIPGALPAELLAPVASGIGVRLLQCMGWRPGRGVGAAAPAAAGGRPGSKWGSVAGVSIENTPLYVLEPKEDHHGLGYDPFEGAEEFRAAKRARRDAAGGGGRGGRGLSGFGGDGGGGGGAQNRGRGVAFGGSVLDDEDGGYTLEDYVDEEGGGGGGGAAGGGAAGGALAIAQKRGLALRFEEVSDESDDADRFERPGPAQLRLQGTAQQELLLLTSRQHQQEQMGSFIPGFRAASTMVEPPSYPPTKVPDSFTGRHVFAHAPGGNGAAVAAAAAAGSSAEAAAAAAVAALGTPPPEAAPPADGATLREVELLAGQVARSGPLVEKLARSQAAAGGRYQFVAAGGEVYTYYLWRLYKLRAALAAAAARAAAGAAATAAAAHGGGGGSGARRDLSIEQRMALLGEAPLPARSGGGGGGGGGTEGAPGAGGGGARGSLAVASADRARLQAALGSTFVRGQQQDMSAAAQEQQGAQAGLRQPAQAAPQASAAAQQFLAAVAGRFAGGSSAETAVLLPDGAAGGVAAGGSVQPPAGAAGGGGAIDADARPTRSSEDWRPAPLLCKRFNVPDPYRGKRAPLEDPLKGRFRAELLALPATQAAATEAAAAALAGGGGDHGAGLVGLDPEGLGPAAAAAAAPAVGGGGEGGAVGASDAGRVRVDVHREAEEFMQQLALELGAGGSGAAGWGAPLLPAAAAPPPAAAPALVAAVEGGVPPLPPPPPLAGSHPASLPPPPPLLPGEASAGAFGEGDPLIEAAAEKPLDLFKAIFEGGDDGDDEEEETDDKQQQQRQQPRQPQPWVPGFAPPASEAQPAKQAQDVAQAAKGLAEALMRSRAAGLPGASAVPAAVGGDDGRRREILEALQALQAGKHKKRKKERKEKQRHRKEKGSGQKKKSKKKEKGRKEERKAERRSGSEKCRGNGDERRRRRSGSDKDSGSGSGSSSDSDSM